MTVRSCATCAHLERVPGHDLAICRRSPLRSVDPARDYTVMVLDKDPQGTVCHLHIALDLEGSLDMGASLP